MENYKEKYEAAIERAKKELKAYDSQDCDAARLIFRLFPKLEEIEEIKKREDERIKEEIILLVKKSNEYGGYALHKDKADRMINWLEKQGEKEETPCDRCRKEQPSHSCQDITSLGRCYMEDKQKPTEEVEPKFKIGDWIINSEGTLRHIVAVDETVYQTDKGWLSRDFYENNFHIWTIQDAKDGDVISYDDGWTCIFKHSDGIWYSSYCFITADGEFHMGYKGHSVDSKINGNSNPATKEQRDLFFEKMKEAGYEWDVKEKKLNLVKS